jgi:hypothetical protein
LRYNVRVDEISTGQPSIGFVSAYFDSHIQEGGKVCPGILYPFQEILVKEFRSVDGNVSRFSYDVEYDSGVKR